MNPRESAGSGSPLRRTAEERLAGVDAPNAGPLETAELAKAMHELLVHQVELELQNEELLEARAELEANAEVLTELYDFAPVGYFSVSGNGFIRQLNFMGARMLGRERNPLLGTSFTEHISPANRSEFVHFLSGIFAGEDASPCEVTLLNRGGSGTIVILTGSLSPNGLVCRMAAMDVSDQRRVEAAAIEKNEDLERIFNLSHDLLGLAGSDGRFRRINPAFERVLGYSREVVTGSDFLTFLHPDDRTSTTRAMALLRTGEEVMDFVNRYRCADGSYRWLEWRATPYGDNMMCVVARDISARKEAEDALRASEERLRLFIEHAPAGIAMFDCDMRYLAASERWKMDYGIAGDVRGIPLYELTPEIPAHWKEVHRRGLAGETLSMDEDSFHRADGSVQWLKWDVRPWFGPDGQKGGILIGEEDITERVHSRDALRASEKRLRLAIDAAKMGSWDWDMRTDEILWSRYHEIIFGYQPGTPRRVYEDFRNRLHPEDVERVEAKLREAIAKRTDYSSEFRVVWPDGSIHWVSALGRLFHDSENQPIRMLGIVMDITAQKEATDSLHRSEEKFRSMVEFSPTAMYLYHLADDGRLILMEANDAADKELGIKHSALIGKPLEQAFPNLVGTDVPATYMAVAKGELGTQQFETRYDGEGISGYLDVHVFQTSPGTIAVAFSDISERMEFQESLERNQEELETRVQLRTVQLQGRTLQLRALADELTHAEERERRRIAGLIHEDLQQMLVAAVLNLGMLKSKVGDGDAARELSHIEGILRDSIRTARSLTAELSPPVLQQCGLAAALKWLRTWYGEKYMMDVKVEVEDDADPCSEVSVTLFQCVRELLFNIVKHAGVRTAGLRMWRPGDGVVKIEVSDEGLGFDPKEVRAREGSVGGFGLFSIRERLEWMGGGFEIESAPGSGSRFTLWAPLARARQAVGENGFYHSPTGSARNAPDAGGAGSVGAVSGT